MNITTAMEGGNTLLMVNASDLKEFALALMDEARKEREQKKEDVFLTESEVMKRLNVTHSTLWRWKRDGYLTPAKIGRKCLWRESDILNLTQANRL